MYLYQKDPCLCRSHEQPLVFRLNIKSSRSVHTHMARFVTGRRRQQDPIHPCLTPCQRKSAHQCLWDTGVQTSLVLTSQLDTALRDNQTKGNAIMDIKCDVLAHGVHQLLECEPPNH